LVSTGDTDDQEFKHPPYQVGTDTSHFEVNVFSEMVRELWLPTRRGLGGFHRTSAVTPKRGRPKLNEENT
jgi:hypothetical protein